MRIQETDRVLKESRYARNAARPEEPVGMFAKAWMKITGLFKKH